MAKTGGDPVGGRVSAKMGGGKKVLSGVNIDVASNGYSVREHYKPGRDGSWPEGDTLVFNNAQDLAAHLTQRLDNNQGETDA